MDTNTKDNYPTTVNGRRCLTPCYPPGHKSVHPVTGDVITDLNDPWCATDKHLNENNVVTTVDDCKQVTKGWESVHIDVVVPKVVFRPKQFLLYYDITNFDQALDFTRENNVSIRTKLRVMEAGWLGYGETVDAVDDQMVNFYTDVIHQLWLEEISEDTKIPPKEIQSRLLTPSNVFKFFKLFVEGHRKLDIPNYNAKIKQLLIQYFSKQTKKSEQ